MKPFPVVLGILSLGLAVSAGHADDTCKPIVSKATQERLFSGIASFFLYWVQPARTDDLSPAQARDEMANGLRSQGVEFQYFDCGTYKLARSVPDDDPNTFGATISFRFHKRDFALKEFQWGLNEPFRKWPVEE